ncbi:MAG: universal stress protein [Nitrospirales bacterium]|nr:universal stress protein [Nitrospirales bacterium]
MKTLLAVDGSEQSYEAARALTGLPPAEELTILTVVTVPGLSYPTLGAGLAKDLSMQVEQAMREEAEKILDQTVSILPPHPGPMTKKLELGEPAEVILNLAKDQNCDLIVLGARGLGQFHEQMFGSVSHRVMTHAHCSTLIVKGHLRKIDNILLPVANQEDGDAAVSFLQKKPFRESVKITVFHVIPFSQPVWPVGAMIPEDFRKEMVAHGEEFTGGIASTIEKLGYSAQGTAVMGAPSFSITDEVTAKTPDLILMRSHSRSGISRFLLGSVSHSVVHHTNSSILLVR